MLKAKTILYWMTTLLTALELLLGAEWDLARQHSAVTAIAHLGYPLYVLRIIGTWKILGGIALLVPGFPRVKEWAYAGIIFEMTGAAASWTAIGDVTQLIAPLFFAAFAVASWALRPQSRTLGVLFDSNTRVGMVLRCRG